MSVARTVGAEPRLNPLRATLGLAVIGVNNQAACSPVPQSQRAGASPVLGILPGGQRVSQKVSFKDWGKSSTSKVDLNLVSVLIIFWLSLVQTLGFSYLGSELAEEAAAVGRAIYDLAWYEHPVELQRYYRLIIQRTQRPTGITGAKLFIVRRTTFASMMQMSYSYYLVLKDVLNKL
uniref:Odorant receptor coreceptor n=1 Tax=Culex pipiens TaxID=7175 RepID=A0A8D8F636_CULPI